MSRQYFEDTPIEPLNIANAAVSFATSELALFPNVSQITIPAADVRPGKVWRLTAAGNMTTSTTGTMIITPGWGTTQGARVALGASAAQTYVPSLTYPWFLQGLWMCRTVGLSGANTTIICQGMFQAQGTLATAGSGTGVPFGGTVSAVCDPTLGGLYIGVTFSVTAATMTPQIVCVQSLN